MKQICRSSLMIILFFGFSVFPQTGRQLKDLKSGQLNSVLDTLITKEMKKQHLPGVVFVMVKDGKVVFEKGYGFANLEKQKTVSTDKTIFRIGSITKVFTAMAILQLAERKNISLDEDVNKYLKHVRIDNKYPGPVRFRHLLTHTAGFDQIGRRRQVAKPSERPTLQEFLKNELVRIRPSGVASCYDTYGITLAGHLVEEISGQTYPDYLKNSIFKPLGMSNANVETPENRKENLALGYGYNGGKYVPQRYEYYVTTPASSIDASGQDMAKFMIALLDKKSPLLSKSPAKSNQGAQFRNHPKIPAFVNGFWEAERNNQQILHHGGTMLGFTSEMYLVPKHNLGFFIAYNRDREAGGGRANLRSVVVRKIMNELFPVSRENLTDKKPLPIPTKRFAGNYANNLYCHTCYENEGWRMFYSPVKSVAPGVLEMDGSRWIAIEPMIFQSTATGTKMAFLEDDNGNIIRATRPNQVMDKLGDHLLEEVLGINWRKNLSSPLIAQVFQANQDWENATLAYKAILKKRPKDVSARLNLGRSLLRANKADEAIRELTEVWELNVQRGIVGFRLAISFALKKDKEMTLKWIKLTIEAGFDEKEVFLMHPTFGFLKDDPRLKELVK